MVPENKKIEDTNKLTLLAFKIIAILHNTRLATFIKLLETVSKGLFGTRSQNTITAIQSFIEKIREALAVGLRAVGIFFYLTKAYDVLNHRVLLDKLWAYGVRGIIYSWFESYLS
jgi:hypothetical protein